MNIINAPQGSAEWLAARANRFTASEAPAMMGESKYQTRADLLRQKHTGIAAEVDANTQRLFDRGHAAEAVARAIVEEIIGDDLFPMTGALEVCGLPLLASFDGITQGRDIVWETKLFNAALAEQVRACELGPHYYWQLEQQLLVSGAERAYFTTSDGTPENTIGMWYESQPARRAALIAGWKQFAEDLANYQHVEPTVAPVAAPIESLPALAVTVTGSISLVHNLERFGKRLTEFVGSLNSKPENDQDFANLDAAVKVLKEAEAQLDAAEANALAQTTNIADMQNLVAMYRKIARDNRLAFEKIVKQEKVNRKAAIVAGAHNAIKDHIAKLEERIGGRWMTYPGATIFTDVIAGLKSLDSIRDKVATALAQAKIDANAIADTIEANRKSLLIGTENDTSHLFPDFAQVCTKAREDFAALHAMRMQQEAARKEAERERIRHEEADRITREAAASKAKAQAANDQLGKQSVAESEPEVQGQDQVAERQSATPIENHNEHLLEMVNDTMIDAFMRLLQNSAADKKVIRAALVKWEKYRVALSLKEAA